MLKLRDIFKRISFICKYKLFKKKHFFFNFNAIIIFKASRVINTTFEGFFFKIQGCAINLNNHSMLRSLWSKPAVKCFRTLQLSFYLTFFQTIIIIFNSYRCKWQPTKTYKKKWILKICHRIIFNWGKLTLFL